MSVGWSSAVIGYRYFYTYVVQIGSVQETTSYLLDTDAAEAQDESYQGMLPVMTCGSEPHTESQRAMMSSMFVVSLRDNQDHWLSELENGNEQAIQPTLLTQGCR